MQFYLSAGFSLVGTVVSAPLIFCALTVFYTPALAESLDEMSLEKAAYHHIAVVGTSSKSAATSTASSKTTPASQRQRDYKREYMKKLSPGGKVYFLACRRDYKEALALLAKLPKNNTGSHLYVKAFCLEGLDRHAEALKCYRAAKASMKVGTAGSAYGFNPGFRFYFQSAAAAINAGSEKDCLEDLDVIEEKSLQRSPNSNYPRYVRAEIKKRRICMVEKKGLHKEAFEKYLALFSETGDQFKLSQPLTGDAQSKSRAAAWLQANPNRPQGVSAEKLGIYLLTAGKANLSMGNIPQATAILKEAAAIEMPHLVWESGGDDPRVLRMIKDESRKLLVKIYFKQKNYPLCCRYIREIFNDEPFQAMKTRYNTISMYDVPQLVSEQDMKEHDERLEADMDLKDFIFDPRRRQFANVDGVSKKR
jgi:tetratricopeptide (TPR) repeat protein